MFNARESLRAGQASASCYALFVLKLQTFFWKGLAFPSLVIALMGSEDNEVRPSPGKPKSTNQVSVRAPRHQISDALKRSVFNALDLNFDLIDERADQLHREGKMEAVDALKRIEQRLVELTIEKLEKENYSTTI